jgi:hypothetical protein
MKTTIIILIGSFIILSVGLPQISNAQEKKTPSSQLEKLTGKEKHKVDLVTAKKLIKKHNASTETSNIRGGFFARNAFEQILAQPGMIGIRYYYAKTDSGVPTLVLVGVDSLGEDFHTGFIAEMAFPCPPRCAVNSELSK